MTAIWIGNYNQPSTWREQDDNSVNNQALVVTVPYSGTLSTLGTWLKPYMSINYKLCVWDFSSRALLAQSAQYATGGSGNYERHEHDLTSPLSVTAGQQLLIGFSHHTQTGDVWVYAVNPNGSGTLYEKYNSSWPISSMSGAATQPYLMSGYARLTYASNGAPNAPTCTTSGKQNSLTPTLSATFTDPDGDAISHYQLQVANIADPGFASPIYDSGSVAHSIASGANYGAVEGTSLTNGAYYYYRFRAYDAGGSATWSTWGTGWFYVDNLPNVPTLATSGNLVGTQPAVVIYLTDPDGDAITQYQIQVTRPSDTGYASPVINDTVTGPWASGTGLGYGMSTPLTRDLTGYIYRARAYDGYFWSAWSTSNPAFTCNTLPTLSGLTPTGNAPCYINNLSAVAVWTSAGTDAHARVYWTFADANGGGQGAFRIRLYTASSGGSAVEDSGKITSAAAQWDSSYGLVNGTEYWWTVEVWDNLDESSGESARQGFHARWGQAIFEYNPSGGATSSQWQFSASPTAAGTQSAFCYATATGANGAGRGAWNAFISGLTPAAYLNVCVRLATNVVSTQPALPDMVFNYVGSGVTPERWSVHPTNDWRLDSSQRRFGSQSLKCLVAAAAGDDYIYPFRNADGDDVPVAQNTNYTFSCFIKTAAPLVNGTLGLRVYRAGGGTPYANGYSAPLVTDTSSFPDGWQRITMQYKTAMGETSIRPAFFYTHANSSGGDVFWVDAFKWEEGTVATAWSPGFVGDAVVLDVNGIMVDASAGGIFRLRGSGGGAFDTIELFAHGFRFGGGPELWSPDGSNMAVTAPSWTAPSLGNSWVNFGSGYAVAGYLKDVAGVVLLRGLIRGGTATPGTVFFTLPAGYRPAYELIFAVVSNEVFGEVRVGTNGDVLITVGNSAWLSLDGISFFVGW